MSGLTLSPALSTIPGMVDTASCRWRPGPADIFFLSALSALALSLGLAPITSNDIWLHLATGNWILDQGQIPAGEVFSFVAAGRPYVAHEWGSQVLLALIHRAAALPGLVAYKTAAALILGLWLYIRSRLQGAPASRAALWAGLALFVAGSQLWARPHLLTWLALAATLELLQRSRWQPRLLMVLPFIQVVWTNLHGGFILGPALVAVWGAGEWLDRRRSLQESPGRPLRTLLTAGAMAAACLINPYGFKLLLFPFELAGSRVFMQAVYEWHSPLTSPYMATTMFAAFAAATVIWLLSLAIPGGRRDWAWSLTLGALLVLALRMNRNVPLFMLAAVPLLATWAPPGWLTRSRGRRLEQLLTATFLLVLTVFIFMAGYPYDFHRFRPTGLGTGPRVPVAAVDTLERMGATGHAFTTYGEGAYLVWRLWPQVQVGMDSRNSVYGEELYLAYRAALRSSEGMQQYLQRWPVSLALAAHSGPFRRGPMADMDRDADQPHEGLLTHGDLLLVDFDDATAAYLHAEAPGLSADISYEVIHPVLAAAGFSAADLPAALTEARRAVQRRPGSVVARWILANALVQAGQPREALFCLAQLEKMDTNQVALSWGVGDSLDAARLFLEALVHQQLGDCPAARTALEKALAYDPAHGPAQLLLKQLDC